MSLLINKDGKQLGPYSLDEARALVLSGELEATDWAWPDGGTKWIPLKEVPGFAPTAPAAASPPPTAPPSAPASTEEELWRGHPSQILNFKAYLLVALFLVIGLGLAPMVVVAGVQTRFWSVLGFGVLGVVILLYALVHYFRLRAIEYVVTTQRVRVISGLFSKDIQEIELFRVKDTAAHQPFFLRLFGLGTITIDSGDEKHPQLILSAVPRAVELRERMRQEVMTLRQRFGVREVDVM